MAKILTLQACIHHPFSLFLRSQYPILWGTSSYGMKHVLAVDTIRVLCIFHVLRIYICVQLIYTSRQVLAEALASLP